MKLPEETIKAVAELGEVLPRIYNRLMREGKITRKDSKTIFLDTPNTEEKKICKSSNML